VKRRGTRGYGTLFGQFLIVPMLALTLWMLLWGLHMTLVRAAGKVVPCRIADRTIRQDSKGKPRHYLIYSYNLNGHSIQSRALVAPDVYLQYAPESDAKAQISPLLPERDAVLLIPGENKWGAVWGMGFVVILMAGMTGALFWLIFVLPARRKQLAIRGVPVAGKLIDKTKYEGARSQGYYFHYEYQPEGAARPLTAQQTVRRSDWDEPVIGSFYTILYDPQQPQTSIIYLYGDYEAM